VIEGNKVVIGASLGIAIGDPGRTNSDAMVRNADLALYAAKAAGRGKHCFYQASMHSEAAERQLLENDLRQAIDRRELSVAYQPIVHAAGEDISGFEALVRWQHPERGLVSPMDFIPVAEDTGQILPIGHWTLKEACRQMQRWQRRFPLDPPLFISVNLSGKQFTQPDLIEQVTKILQETRLDPRSLKLEITESVVMENIENATEMLKHLRGLGVRLSIDDFGTGYSSLSYLHRFPIDTLKIDRSFVIRMVDNNENIEIVRTILMLAKNLGMDVVAEGVETKEQLALLRKLGCENGQGYFFSKPTSVSGAEKLISDTCTLLRPIPQAVQLKTGQPSLIA
jgi:EAL domain-containing protein (putative c-di-GMP-specific phosphodiesterase class I)